ncbi:MAG: hypothetical protein HQM08_00660 [Candidatus Riflebacteria bacterium]|nr:hypothetical protein [Candidatus Riflebacteria bacterium]
MEKTIFPAALIEVTGVTPFDIKWTVASDTTTLPTAVIALKSESGVPSNIISYSISYYTLSGDPVPELRIEETPMNFFVTANTAVSVTLSPYTTRVVDFFSKTTANVSPLKVSILLTIKDVNGNIITREAYCQLYRPVSI